MQQKVKKGMKMVKQELKEREEVEAEINIVKSWIQETKEYLLSPDAEVDIQLQELQVYQICQLLNHNISKFLNHNNLLVNVNSIKTTMNSN